MVSVHHISIVISPLLVHLPAYQPAHGQGPEGLLTPAHQRKARACSVSKPQSLEVKLTMLTNDVEMHLDHVLDMLDILDCGFSNFPLGTLRNASVPQSKGLGMAAWSQVKSIVRVAENRTWIGSSWNDYMLLGDDSTSEVMVKAGQWIEDTNLNLYIYIYICMYVYIYIYNYICIYTILHISSHIYTILNFTKLDVLSTKRFRLWDGGAAPRSSGRDMRAENLPLKL